MTNFSFDKRALGRVIDQAMQQQANDGQQMLDRLLADCADQPVEHIKPVLQREWAEAFEGGSITEPDLTTWATALSAGQRIVLQTQPVQL
jgi:hypothetical protein